MEGRMSVPYTERFAQIPQWWLDLYAKQATDLQFRVYVVARSYAYGHRQSAWPSNGTLAEQCGCVQRKIPQTLKYWEEQGVVIRKPYYNEDGKQMPNRIIFVIPPEIQTYDPTMPLRAGMPDEAWRGCPQRHGEDAPEGTRIRQDESNNEKQTRQDGPVGSGYDDVIQFFSNTVGRTVHKSEKRFLISLVNKWSVEDVTHAITEYYIRKPTGIKSPTRYIAGVIENCAREGGRI